MRKIENTDIEKNIENLLKWGTALKVISFVITGILFIACIIIGIESLVTAMSMPIPTLFIAVAGLVTEQFFKWKAYMLYTNYKK